MLFFYKRIITISVILFALASTVCSQYAGGDGSGSILTSKMQTSCPSVSYPAIFAGGMDNGFSRAGITQSICSPLIMPAIFNGGSGNSENSYPLNAGCAPMVNFEVDTTFTCAGNTVYFTDVSEGNPVSWSWSFPGGDPSISTIQNPSVIYNIPGSFDVTLSITSLSGYNIITKTNHITIGALPSVSLSSFSPLCENASAYPLSGGSPVGGTYSGSGIASGVFDPAIAGTGTQTISYKYTDGYGCSDSADTDIIVNPVYSFNTTHVICEGETYNWHGTDYTAANTYTANYTSIHGCDSIYTLNLTVNPAYAFTENHSICNGETYNWHGSNYTIANTYTANYTSIHGCDSIYTLNLTVNFTDATLTVTDNTLTANATGATYQWLDCDNLYAPVIDATLQSYTATASGNFAVQVTQGSCADTSDCEQINIVGIAPMPAEEVSIYPNPVSNELTIEMKGNKETTDFEILNSSGQVVFKGKMLEKTVISTSEFVPGVYLLKLENGKSLLLKKIIKE